MSLIIAFFMLAAPCQADTIAQPPRLENITLPARGDLNWDTLVNQNFFNISSYTASQIDYNVFQTSITLSSGVFVSGTGYIQAAASISASGFFGDGSHLTGVPSTAAINVIVGYVNSTGAALTSEILRAESIEGALGISSQTNAVAISTTGILAFNLGISSQAIAVNVSTLTAAVNSSFTAVGLSTYTLSQSTINLNNVKVASGSCTQPYFPIALGSNTWTCQQPTEATNIAGGAGTTEGGDIAFQTGSGQTSFDNNLEWDRAFSVLYVTGYNSDINSGGTVHAARAFYGPLYWLASPGAHTWQISYDYLEGAFPGGLAFFDITASPGTSRMILDPNGYVGISNDFPNYTLDVNGIINSNNTIQTGSSVTASAFFGDGSHLNNVFGGLSGGTAGRFAYWTSSNTLGNSTIISDSAESITIGGASVTVHANLTDNSDITAYRFFGIGTYLTGISIDTGAIASGKFGDSRVGITTAAFLSGTFAETYIPHTLSSSVTVNNNFLSNSSVTASSFFGDGSHLSGLGGALSGGTVNAIPYWTAANALGNSQIFRDGSTSLTITGSTMTVAGNAFSVGSSTLAASAGNVGVGTSAPVYTLHVAGSEYTTGQDIIGGTLTVIANAFSVGGSTLSVINGNVGIGVATPITALDVEGTAGKNLNIAKFLQTNSGTGNETYLWVGQSVAKGRAGGLGFKDNTSGNNGLTWLANCGDNTGTGLVVAQGGNVGVGLTAPIYTLHVSGSEYTTVQDIVGGTMTVQGNAFSVGDSNFAVSGSNVGIGTSTPLYTLHVAGNEYKTGQDIVGGTMTVQGNAFSVGGSGFVVAASGVGIGTTNPSELLTLGADNAGQPRAAIFMPSNTYAYGPPSAANTWSNGDKLIFLNQANQKTSIGVDGLSNIWLANSSNVSGGGGFDFYTGAGTGAPTKNVSILQNGNVGIGTSIPAYALHVANTAGVYNAGQSIVAGQETVTGTMTVSGQYLSVNTTGYAYSGYGTISVGGANGAELDMLKAGTRVLSIWNDATNVHMKNMLLGADWIVLDAAGGVGLYSQSMAQLLAIAPAAAGRMYYCNNCSPVKIVISTGTAAGNFADMVGGQFK